MKAVDTGQRADALRVVLNPKIAWVSMGIWNRSRAEAGLHSASLPTCFQQRQRQLTVSLTQFQLFPIVDAGIRVNFPDLLFLSDS